MMPPRDQAELVALLSAVRAAGASYVRVSQDEVEAHLLPLPPSLPIVKVPTDRPETEEETLERELFG
jgi:hypothetical protein